MIAPNCMFYASANILSSEINAMFKSNTASLSYTLVSIPSIFTVFSISMAIDALGVWPLFPCLQLTVMLGTVFCVLGAEFKKTILFLIGRFLYGVAGECTLTSQSKVIATIIPKDMLSAAYAIAFCGYMLGESLAGWILPIGKYAVRDSMLLVLGLQTFGLIFSFIYSIHCRNVKR